MQCGIHFELYVYCYVSDWNIWSPSTRNKISETILHSLHSVTHWFDLLLVIIIEWGRLEGASKEQLVQPPPSFTRSRCSTPQPTCPRTLPAMGHPQLWATYQCLTTLITKYFSFVCNNRGKFWVYSFPKLEYFFHPSLQHPSLLTLSVSSLCSQCSLFF